MYLFEILLVYRNCIMFILKREKFNVLMRVAGWEGWQIIYSMNYTWRKSGFWDSFLFPLQNKPVLAKWGKKLSLITLEWELLAYHAFVAISESLLSWGEVIAILHSGLLLWEPCVPFSPSKPGLVLDPAACLINSSCNLWLLRAGSCQGSLWHQ